MISSTSIDLPEHRPEVRDACLREGYFPDMMESLPARDADAIKVSLEMVDRADVYIGIYAWRYGHKPEGHDISITEMECNRAVERGIPILVFVIHICPTDHALDLILTELEDRGLVGWDKQSKKDEVFGLCRLGLGLAVCGAGLESEIALQRALRLIIPQKHQQAEGQVNSYLGERLLWFGDPKGALSLSALGSWLGLNAMKPISSAPLASTAPPHSV